MMLLLFIDSFGSSDNVNETIEASICGLWPLNASGQSCSHTVLSFDEIQAKNVIHRAKRETEKIYRVQQFDCQCNECHRIGPVVIPNNNNTSLKLISKCFRFQTDDPNTNTFRVIQEQTAAMAFEWKQMTHKSFGYVYLVHDVYFWGDNTVKVYGGNIGLLEAIGQPCDVTKYRAEGYTTGFFPSNFRTYQMTYKRVPKISNVRIKLMPNLYPHTFTNSIIIIPHERRNECGHRNVRHMCGQPRRISDNLHLARS
ncbi:hypothetical protein Smp_166720 [Schistosoma mansoni]|uniref:Gnk2-homologous domain-containing protein n=1 Tax=Schistosoma mansoni TaxID=6183 RepID=G4VN30_SCHMA|nr:hypothetical protein Smp_166720 [Schistosoma mansoni]|eukprot:XP_018653665.1 hypothetical protein Smp_166720 [Schistosoma mansoni]